MNERGNWTGGPGDHSNEFVSPPVPIAIIGMGCRLPGGVVDYEGMWEFLLDRRTAIREIPEERWSLSGYHDDDPNAPGRGRSRWAGLLDRVFDFDPAFFDLSPREALAMDPQQRMLLQVAYEAAQDADRTLAELSDARTGIFVGISSMEFTATQRVQTGSGDIFGGTGSALSIAANRISHRLNFRGPSFVVDTACSSALVALDQACRNLADGACDYALAGGVNCLLDPSAFVAFAKANMLSPSGGCYTFDSRADGFIRGEGAGLVLLKRFDAAQRDGDRIHAVIRATGVNQDGRTSTLTSPNGLAQEALMREVIGLAGLEPSDIGYVEAHGTGTPTGDPIEAGAIGRVFGRDRDSNPLPVSSIKPNIGHLESAAGIAGIIKGVMTLKTRTVAPHQNFENPNPAIPLDALNLTVPVEAMPFGDETGPRRIVVNSFGFGGTSACAVLEEFDQTKRAAPVTIDADRGRVLGPQLVPISAPSAEGLAGWANKLSEAVRGNSATAGEVAAAMARRDHFISRAVVLAGDPDAGRLADALHRIAGVEEAADGGHDVVSGKARPGRRLAFAFSGQGAQWWAMGRKLLEDDGAYRASIDSFDRHFEPLSGWKVADALAASEEHSRINEGHVTQGALIAMQVALAAAWRERGIEPDLVFGHSLGEIAAAHVSGAISLETTARIIYQRGLITEQSPEKGAMAAVGLPEDEARAFLTEGEDVVIGAMNGPAMVTLSGLSEPLDRVLAAIAEARPDTFIRKLNTGFAWHSRLLDHGEQWFREGLGEVEWTAPKIPIISTVEPGFQTRFDLDYWWQNLRKPVRYREAVLLALEIGYDSFLEIGPHKIVTPLTVSVANERSASVLAVPSLIRGSDDHHVMARTAAQLYVGGHQLDWSRYAPRTMAAAFRPPLYPWQNQRLRQYSTEAGFYLNEPTIHPLLGRREFGPTPRWMSEIDGKAFSYFRDHRILGGAVLPAAGYVEMMIAAIRDANGPGDVELRRLQFPEALPLDGDVFVILRTIYDPVSGRIRVYSRERGDDEDWRLRAEGYGLSRPIAIPADAPPKPPTHKAEPTIDGPGFYDLAAKHGYEYGRQFRGVDNIWLTGDLTSVATIMEPEGLDAEKQGYTLHPATFDSALQSAIAIYDRNNDLWFPDRDEQPDIDPDEFVMRIPVEIDKILVFGDLPARSICEFIADETGDAGIYRLYGEDGRPSVIVERLRTKVLKSNKRGADDIVPAAYYTEHFRPVSSPQSLAEDADAIIGSWLVVAASEDSGRALAASLVARGAKADTVSLTDTSFGALAERLTASEEASPIAGIVFAPLVGANVESPARATNAAMAEMVALVELVAGLESETKPRIVLVTSGARHIRGDGDATPAMVASRALLVGFRAAMNERPQLKLSSLDIGNDGVAGAEALANAILAEDAELERVLRGDIWYAPRLEPVTNEHQRPRRITIDTKTSGANYSVSLSQPGSLDNIVLREFPMPVAKKGEIVVEIAAVGLNFRDIMAATSILPGEREGDDAWWRNLGFEFSGVVKSVGPGVRTHKVGDRVIGLGKGFMRRFAKVEARAASKLPDNLDLNAAATIPIAFLTAEYCLVELGRLKRGESVLIHLGTGGVGLAAIQVARAIGAKIFATAGSDEKRAYLRDLGIEHVMDSRSLDFAEEVRAATGGRGVDVVLNSLSGAGIEKGLECLATLGRFIEIGKRDLAADRPIGLRSLYHNNSYAVFDLGEILDDAPELLAKPFRRILKMIAKGTYQPLPTTDFPASKAADAMRHLAKAVHIGKVVVAFNETEISVERDLARPAELRGDASYLVTGGLRGFGLTIAEWLAAHGAGRLVLASRKGAPDKADEKRVAKLGKKADVQMVALDVTDEAAVAALIREFANGDKPLAGIFHSAAVIDDALLEQLTPERIAGVVDPKLGGAWNLHNAAEAAGAKLDHFVTFSSVAAAIGSIGQANYVAANAGLERLSELRKSKSLPAMAIGWGSLADSGFVARSDALKSYLSSAGIRPLTDEEALGAFDRLIRMDDPSMVFAAVDWAALSRALPGGTLPRLAPLAADRARGSNRLAVRLASAPEEEHEAIVAEAIREEVARVLRIEPSAIALDRKLTELGLDSLSSFELKNHIEALCDLTIPVAKFLQAPTVAGLASIVTSLLAAERAKQESSDDETGRSSARTDERALPTLARQRFFLGLADSPAVNDQLRSAAVLQHVVRVDGLIDAESIGAAVARLAETEDALRLSAVLRDDGWQVEAGAAPALQILGVEDLLEALPNAGGALWSFALRETDGESKELIVTAHRAAADHASVERAAQTALSLAKGEAASDPASSWADFARGQWASEESPAYRRDYSFWAEMLSRAPAPLLPAERARARMPGRLGMPRGPIAVKTGKLGLEAFERLSADEQEVAAISAFARAIAMDLGSDAVVIERHDPFRRDTAEAPLGPVADALPIIINGALGPAPRLANRTRRALDGARAHRAFDRAAIDRVFERLLTERPVAVGEFGFSLVEAGGGAFAETAITGEPWNALRVNLISAPDGSSVQFVFDRDAVSEAEIDRIARGFSEELAGLLGADAASWNVPKLEQRPVEVAFTARRAAKPAAPTVVKPQGGLLPVTMQQKALLEGLVDPRTTDPFRRIRIITRAYWVRPGMDPDVMRSILDQLMQRHETLRSRFVMKDGAFFSKIDESPPNPLVVEDLGDVDEEVGLAHYRELAAAPLDPLSDQLYAVRLIRCGKAGDLLVSIGHHSILDSWAMSLLAEETMAVLFGLPLQPVELTMAQYLAEYDRSLDRAELERRERYFRRLFADPPQRPNLGRAAKGAPLNLDLRTAGPGAELVSPLGRSGKTAFAENAKSAGASETSLLVAAYAEAIAARGHVDDVAILVPAAMRTDRRLRSFVGWLSAPTPVLARTTAFPSTGALAASLYEQMRESSGHLPADFTIQGDLRRDLNEAGSYISLFSSGMLNVDTLYRNSPTAAIHRAGGSEEIDFGPVKLKKVGGSGVRSDTIWELDLRSFDSEAGPAIRLGYDTLGFSEAEAADLLAEVIDRIGAGDKAEMLRQPAAE